jgi:hypothetical protein
MRAIWNGQVLAESDETVVVENNHYFPIDSLGRDFFKASSLSDSSRAQARLLMPGLGRFSRSQRSMTNDPFAEMRERA